ncbi:MAG: hypothetical protein GKR77_03840, partial [Legionellales bacterium]|nr:hypothetical protein [Legionellales bacterium]
MLTNEDTHKLIDDKLKAFKALEILNLSDNNIGDVGAKIIAESLGEFAELRHLSLSYNPMGGMGLVTILSNLHTVDTIHFAGNEIDEKDIPAVAGQLVVSETLKNLTMSHRSISGLAAMKILDAVSKTKISWFQFYYNDFSNVVDSPVKSFVENRILKDLNLRGNEIDDASVPVIIIPIAKAFKALESLNLSDNNIGDVGAKIIAERLGEFAELRHLSLSYNPMGGMGLVTILSNLHTVDTIHFAGNEI